MAIESLFCAFCFKNTIRKALIVVPVIITNCHVLKKLNNGPVSAHISTTLNAPTNAGVQPNALVNFGVNILKKPTCYFEFFFSIFLIF